MTTETDDCLTVTVTNPNFVPAPDNLADLPAWAVRFQICSGGWGQVPGGYIPDHDETWDIGARIAEAMWSFHAYIEMARNTAQADAALRELVGAISDHLHGRVIIQMGELVALT